MKAASTIRKNLRELRELIDSSDDPIETRIAYAMETAVRWATEETVGWPGLVKQAKVESAFLHEELERK